MYIHVSVELHPQQMAQFIRLHPLYVTSSDFQGEMPRMQRNKLRNKIGCLNGLPNMMRNHPKKTR
jgi:hypothetical protein